MQDSIQIEEIAAHWLARKDAQGLSVAEQAELTVWLDASAAQRVAYIRLEAAWLRVRKLNLIAPSMSHGDLPLPSQSDAD